MSGKPTEQLTEDEIESLWNISRADKYEDPPPVAVCERLARLGYAEYGVHGFYHSVTDKGRWFLHSLDTGAADA